MAMKKMLVTLDGSPRSETVLPIVIALASEGDYRATLFSVWEALPGQLENMGEESARELRISGVKFLRSYLAIVAEAVAMEGIEVTTEVWAGHPPTQILAAAGELGPDLIVMASAGHGGVTDEVVRGSPVPVLVLGPRLLEAWPPKEVHVSSTLTFLEGSVVSVAALPVAMDIARAAGTEGSLLRTPSEVLRYKIEELIDTALASCSGH